MKSDAAFLSALEESHRPVWHVAQWLTGEGYDVRMVPSLVRINYSQRHAYADNGDLEVTKKIEVKRRSFNFTCEQDYPYDTVFVDETHKVDRVPANQRDAYVILSADCAAAVVIPANPACRIYWSVVTHWDPKEGRECSWYAVPKTCCRFERTVGGSGDATQTSVATSAVSPSRRPPESTIGNGSSATGVAINATSRS